MEEIPYSERLKRAKEVYANTNHITLKKYSRENEKPVLEGELTNYKNDNTRTEWHAYNENGDIVIGITPVFNGGIILNLIMQTFGLCTNYDRSVIVGIEPMPTV